MAAETPRSEEIGLHNLKPKPGSKRPRKRIGRGEGSGLGKTRYVIERTMAWLSTNRRLKLCYERNGEHFRAFHVLAACVICANRLRPKKCRRRL